METPSWFEPFKKMIIALFDAIFGSKEEIKKDTLGISMMPLFGDKGAHVEALQTRLNYFGEGIVVDGAFGPLTRNAVSNFQKAKGLAGSGVLGPKTLELLGLVIVEPERPKGKAPWFWELQKHKGKTEFDTKFQEYMNKFWVMTGLPHFKGLVGSARAWCGIFAAAGLVYAGYQFPVNSFRAISWDTYCQEINWKVDGFPQGAFVRINSRSDCKSLSGNHVTLANGDCSAQDLNRPGAVFSAYGGNQQDSAKVSNYAVSRICAVRWPCEELLPPRITKSVNCSNGQTESNESTR